MPRRPPRAAKRTSNPPRPVKRASNPPRTTSLSNFQASATLPNPTISSSYGFPAPCRPVTSRFNPPGTASVPTVQASVISPNPTISSGYGVSASITAPSFTVSTPLHRPDAPQVGLAWHGGRSDSLTPPPSSFRPGFPPLNHSATTFPRPGFHTPNQPTTTFSRLEFPAGPGFPAPNRSATTSPQNVSQAPAVLHVANLNPDVAEPDLYNHFRRIGDNTIAYIRVFRNSQTGESLLCGLIAFHREEDAKRAFESLNYAEISGRSCSITWYSNQEHPLNKPASTGIRSFTSIYLMHLNSELDAEEVETIVVRATTDIATVTKVWLASHPYAHGEGSCGFAIVNFESLSGAARALELFQDTEKVNEVAPELLHPQLILCAAPAGRKKQMKEWAYVYIGNLTESLTLKRLEEEFRPYGDIVEVNILGNQKAGTDQRGGFVRFEKAWDANRAAAKDGFPLGQPIYVALMQLQEQQLKTPFPDPRMMAPYPYGPYPVPARPIAPATTFSRPTPYCPPAGFAGMNATPSGDIRGGPGLSSPGGRPQADVPRYPTHDMSTTVTLSPDPTSTQSSTFSINIRRWEAVQVQPNESILQVKKKLLAPADQRLFFEDRELQDSMTLAEASIGQDTTLDLGPLDGRMPQLDSEQLDAHLQGIIDASSNDHGTTTATEYHSDVPLYAKTLQTLVTVPAAKRESQLEQVCQLADLASKQPRAPLPDSVACSAQHPDYAQVKRVLSATSPLVAETVSVDDITALGRGIENVTGCNPVSGMTRSIIEFKFWSDDIDRVDPVRQNSLAIELALHADICRLYGLPLDSVRINYIISGSIRASVSLPSGTVVAAVSCDRFTSLKELFRNLDMSDEFHVSSKMQSGNHQQLWDQWIQPLVLNLTPGQSHSVLMSKFYKHLGSLALLSSQVRVEEDLKNNMLKIYGSLDAKSAVIKFFMDLDDSLSSLNMAEGNYVINIAPERASGQYYPQLWKYLYERASKWTADQVLINRPSKKLQLNTLRINPELEKGCPVAQKFIAAVMAMGLDPLDPPDVFSRGIPNGGFGWHGTKTTDGVKGISHDNLLPGLRKGQVWGPGEYCARTANTSLEYASSTNTLFVFFILDDRKYYKFQSHHVVNNPKDGNTMYMVPVLLATFDQQTPIPVECSQSAAKTSVRWQWRDDRGWVDYGTGQSTFAVQTVIEDNYARQCRDQTRATFTLEFVRLNDGNRQKYEINLSNLTQRNLQTQYTRRIQRVCEK